MRAALITVSTSKAAGVGEDESGLRLAEFACRLGAEIVGRDLIADDRAEIERRLRHWADVERCEYCDNMALLRPGLPRMRGFAGDIRSLVDAEDPSV